MEDLVTQLQNININSETAKEIAHQYFMYKYVSLAAMCLTILGLFSVVLKISSQIHQSIKELES